MRPYPELSAVVYRLPFLPLKHYPSSFGCLNPQSKLVSERTRELATRKGQLISKAKLEGALFLGVHNCKKIVWLALRVQATKT